MSEMKNLQEIFPYVWLVMALVSSILAVALAGSAKNLTGKGWLVASLVIVLMTKPLFQMIQFIAQHSENPREVYAWYDVLNLFSLFGTACFGLFLFSNWIQSRMKLDMKHLLFSYSGRISRSAFWISLCILFPLGTVIGFAPFTSQAAGIPKVIIWMVYAGSLVLSLWISLAVYTKRWHDCAKSGWMSLILLIPVVGFFWFMGYLGFVNGTTGPNPYGDDSLSTPQAP